MRALRREKQVEPAASHYSRSFSKLRLMGEDTDEERLQVI
jgi:hypothetical protein